MPQIILTKNKRLQLLIGVSAMVVAVILVIMLGLYAMAELQYQNTERQAKQLSSQNLVAAEISLLEKYLDTQPPERYQKPVAEQLGSVAYKAQQYVKAYSWYLRAWTLEGSKPKLETVLGVAQSAQQVGDKPTAISFYRKAISLIPKATDGMDVLKVNDYKNQIRYLGGTP